MLAYSMMVGGRGGGGRRGGSLARLARRLSCVAWVDLGRRAEEMSSRFDADLLQCPRHAAFWATGPKPRNFDEHPDQRN